MPNRLRIDGNYHSLYFHGVIHRVVVVEVSSFDGLDPIERPVTAVA